MTRTTISVFTLALVLAAATSASAECAWVLWATYVDGTKPVEHGIEEAFETKADCEGAIPMTFASQLEMWTDLYGERGGKVTSKWPNLPLILVDKHGMGSKEDQMLIRLSCWPLGLQPRSIIGGAEYPTRDDR